MLTKVATSYKIAWALGNPNETTIKTQSQIFFSIDSIQLSLCTI